MLTRRRCSRRTAFAARHAGGWQIGASAFAEHPLTVADACDHLKPAVRES